MLYGVGLVGFAYVCFVGCGLCWHWFGILCFEFGAGSYWFAGVVLGWSGLRLEVVWCRFWV